MKTCAYCGRQVEQGALRCEGCGTDLPQETTEEQSTEQPSAAPRPLNLKEIEGAFTLCAGFSRPELRVIVNAVRQHSTSEERLATWAEAISQWAGRWETELGEDFWLTSSGSIFLLSELDGEAAERTLQKANKMATIIRGVLGTLAWEGRPQTLIVHVTDESLAGRFADAVTSPDPPDTIQSAALACAPHWLLITRPDESVRADDIASDFSWSCLSHLQLPGWLYSGVGRHLGRVIALARSHSVPELFNADLIPNHRRFWFEDTIQSFWAATCATEHPEYQDLYYDLANILVYFVTEKTSNLADFLRCANPCDAGQAAARVCLKTDLGELAGQFLGPGQWAPDPLAIAECWERARQISASEDSQ